MIDAALKIEFNNLGAVLLNEGNRQDALHLFKGASQLMAHIVSRGNETNNATIGKKLCDSRIRYAHVIYEKHRDVDDFGVKSDRFSMNFSDDLDDSSSGRSKAFICKRAILLTKEHLPSKFTQWVKVCSSVVLYNIALVYHLAALDSVLESSGPTALKVYEMTLSLLSGENLESGSTLIGRVKMYCLNNMASLNHELVQWKLSAQYMKRLTIIAKTMQARGVGRSLHEECQSFLLNAMVLKTPNRAPVA